MTRYRDFAIGLIFIGGLVIAGAITLAVKGPSMLVGPQFPALRIWFRDVYGLQAGDEVRTAGMRVGQVERLEYFPTGRVLVECAMLTRVRLAESAEFRIKAKSTLGGRYLDIRPGEGPQAPPEKEFQGLEGGDIFEQLAGFLERNRDPIEQIIRHFEGITADVKHMTEFARRGQGVLGALIYNARLAEDLKSAVADLKGIIADVQAGEGTVGRFFKDPTVYDDIRAVVERVKEGEGPIGVLLTNEEAGRQVRETVEAIRDLAARARAGEGTVGKLFRESKLYDDLAAAAADVRATMEEVREGEGLLPHLLRERSVRERFDRIVTNIDEITYKVNRGDGTIAQLINSRKVFDDLTQILFLAREAVEDMREQAPINTFTNVIFSAF